MLKIAPRRSSCAAAAQSTGCVVAPHRSGVSSSRSGVVLIEIERAAK
jgi:hypothetical protein